MKLSGMYLNSPRFKQYIFDFFTEIFNTKPMLHEKINQMYFINLWDYSL